MGVVELFEHVPMEGGMKMTLPHTARVTIVVEHVPCGTALSKQRVVDIFHGPAGHQLCAAVAT